MALPISSRTPNDLQHIKSLNEQAQAAILQANADKTAVLVAIYMTEIDQTQSNFDTLKASQRKWEASIQAFEHINEQLERAITIAENIRSTNS